MLVTNYSTVSHLLNKDSLCSKTFQFEKTRPFGHNMVILFSEFIFFFFIFSTLYQVSGIRFFLLIYVLVRDRMSLMTLMKQKEEGSSESKVLRFWLVDVPLSILKSHSNVNEYRKTCLNFGLPERKLVFSPHLWQYELFPFKDLKASLLHTGIKYT